MKNKQTTSVAVLLTIAGLLSATPVSAAMSPALRASHPAVQHVDCAVGFHLGDTGVCIIGVDSPPASRETTVVEHHDAMSGCESKSVTKTNDEGDSVTKTRSNCD